MSEKDKKAFVLRINPALLKEIEQWAANEFRSTNGQIEYLLSEAIKSKKKTKSKKSDTED
ncbi:Arc family DNA binding domain-containing protein [Pedobacter frigiditerrae]|uniref:Arc family DNA binding domain-containing protein n=1 Tax=Pedobacter frigiditerrae TaxID=2530452 RepID=A0A4V2MIY0_9SPHI|nr:Arc family DNA binding domain-containing protein [Pedobacter frigiditerrae]TCC91796.1 Arc family DNA binding domain-containing protein [Pedobacter frigiditerrae]